MKKLKALVLAAGKGTRLRTEGSDLPKVMRLANGEPLLRHVLKAIDFLPPADTVIVVGYQRETVIPAFPGYGFAVQEKQLGTGHAVMCAKESLDGFNGDLLVCYGDMPLLKRETYQALIETHRRENAACTILSGSCSEPLAYGRVIRDENGNFMSVVEDRDCTPSEKLITELNTGVYVFDAGALFSVIDELGCENSQGEYYLTDVPSILLKRDKRVIACRLTLDEQIIGVNTQEQLEIVEACLKSHNRHP